MISQNGVKKICRERGKERKFFNKNHRSIGSEKSQESVEVKLSPLLL